MAAALRVRKGALKTIVLLTFLMRAADQQQAEGCGGTFTQPSGSVASPMYPRNYPHNQDCTYIIRASAGHRITLTFLAFQIEHDSNGCPYDFVQIRDGDSIISPSLGIFCNTTVLAKVRSASNSLWIRFHSDSSQSAAGFEAFYYTAIVPQKFLLLTNTFLKAIHRMDLETGSNFIIPIEGLQNPIAVDYDPVDSRLYWTDVVEKTIRSAALDGSSVQLVRNLGPEAVPDGLALDSVSRLIFYTDGGNDVIAVIAMNSFTHKVVVGSGLDQPRAIELDKINGVIFWSDWGVTPKIERANYDGTERKTLVSGYQHLYWPNGLALDTVGKRLYWVDGFIDKLCWTDLEGTTTSVIVALPGTHFFGLDLYFNDLFVTDWGPTILSSQLPSSFIHQISTDGKVMKTIGSVPGRLNDIHLYSEADDTGHMTRPGHSGCGNNNGGCSYLCVPANGNGTKCLHPDGITSHVPKTTAAVTSTTSQAPKTTAAVTSTTSQVPKTTADVTSTTSQVPKTTADVTSAAAGVPNFTPDVIRSTSGANSVVTDSRQATNGGDGKDGNHSTGISLQLVIIIVGCVVVSITIASCASIVIIVKKLPGVADDSASEWRHWFSPHDNSAWLCASQAVYNERHQTPTKGKRYPIGGRSRGASLRFLRQRSNDLSLAVTSYGGVKAGYTSPKSVFARELSDRSENIYDEPLCLLDSGLSPAEDDGGYLHPVSADKITVTA